MSGGGPVVGAARVILGLDKTGFTRDLKGTRGEVQTHGKAMAGSFSAIGVAAKAAAIGGIGLAVVELKKSVDVARQAEAAHARMKTQLTALGISYDDHASKISTVIDKQSLMSGFIRKDMDDSFTRLVRVTKDVNKALEYNALAADIARAKQIPLETATMIVTKAAFGQVGALKRQGIEIAAVTTATDALKASHSKASQAQIDAAKASDNLATRQSALAALQKTFAGQADAYGKTEAGAADRFHVAMENLQEGIGKRVLPALTKLLNLGTEYIDRLSKSKQAQELANSALAKAHSLFTAAVSIGKALIPVLKTLGDGAGRIAKLVGGWDNAFKILISGLLLRKVLALAGGFKTLAGQEGIAAATGSLGKGGKGGGGLLGAFAALPPQVKIPIVLAISAYFVYGWVKKLYEKYLGADFSGTTGDTAGMAKGTPIYDSQGNIAGYATGDGGMTPVTKHGGTIPINKGKNPTSGDYGLGGPTAPVKTKRTPSGSGGGGGTGGGGSGGGGGTSAPTGLGAVSSPNDRPGVATKAIVIQMARRIAYYYGATLTLGAGSMHNQYVSGTHNTVESDHWLGNAVDIPASGAALVRLGQAALQAAGMSAGAARQHSSFAGTVSGWQIIFNCVLGQGGDHTNHLHLGWKGGSIPGVGASGKAPQVTITAPPLSPGLGPGGSISRAENNRSGVGSDASRQNIAEANRTGIVPGVAGVQKRVDDLKSGTVYVPTIDPVTGLRILTPVAPTAGMWMKVLAALRAKLRAAVSRRNLLNRQLTRALRAQFRDAKLIAAIRARIKSLSAIITMLQRDIGDALITIKDINDQAASQAEKEGGEGEVTQHSSLDLTGITQSGIWDNPDAAPSTTTASDATPPDTGSSSTPGPTQAEIDAQINAKTEQNISGFLTQLRSLRSDQSTILTATAPGLKGAHLTVNNYFLKPPDDTTGFVKGVEFDLQAML